MSLLKRCYALLPAGGLASGRTSIGDLKAEVDIWKKAFLRLAFSMAKSILVSRNYLVVSMVLTILTSVEKASQTLTYFEKCKLRKAHGVLLFFFPCLFIFSLLLIFKLHRQN